jgi:hypothetical protein
MEAMLFKHCGAEGKSKPLMARPTLISNNAHPLDPALAEEMNRLSVKERELVLEEIHGVADAIEETPELVSSSLAKMRDIIVILTAKKYKRALDRALFLKPGIATDDKFHLLFLRAERFDPSKAASKMCRYFEHKMELFGYENLAKRITLEDLDENDMRALYEGSFQVITVNHRGLQAFFASAQVVDCVQDWKSVARYYWYQVMAALEDEEVQKRGIVVVSNLVGRWKQPSSKIIDFLLRSGHILTDFPFRHHSVHFLCSESPAIRTFVGMVHKVLPSDLKLRQKVHFGSDLELQYALRHYGVHLSSLCKAGEGLCSREHIEVYLDHRRQKEAEFRLREQRDDNQSCISNPSREYDILMGRGRPYQEWPANIRLVLIVAQHVPRYLQATRRIEKTSTIESIYEYVQNELGGRFLQRTDTGWEIGDESVAREKIAQLLRQEVRAAKEAVSLSSLLSNPNSDEENGNVMANKRPRIE